MFWCKTLSNKELYLFYKINNNNLTISNKSEQKWINNSNTSKVQ